VGLRRHPTHSFEDVYCSVTDGPADEACEIQLTCTLESLGYFDGPFFELSELRKGDIVFTEETVWFQGEYWSNHAMIFYEWVEGSSSHAYILDYHNERGMPYERNITVNGSYTKAFFYYRYNSGEATDIVSNVSETNKLIVYPTVTNEFITVEANDIRGKELIVCNIQGQIVDRTKIDADRMEYNFSSLPKGFYLLKIDGFTVQKIIKL